MAALTQAQKDELASYAPPADSSFYDTLKVQPTVAATTSRNAQGRSDSSTKGSYAHPTIR